MAKRLYESVNYIIAIDEGIFKRQYQKKEVRYETSLQGDYRIIQNGLDETIIEVDDIPNWLNAKNNGVPYDEDSMVDFLDTFTGGCCYRYGVQSVTGPQVDNTDPINPYVIGHLNRIYVTQSNYETTLGGIIDPTKEYFVDGFIDIGSNPVTIPSSGALIKGYAAGDEAKTYGSGLYTSEINGEIITGANAGTIFIRSIALEASGMGGKVFNVTANTGNEAIEMTEVNFNNCTSIGEAVGFRQGLEANTGRFGGTPELTLTGIWSGGYRVDVSNAFGLSDLTSLFKAGPSLTIGGRFIVNINVDLPNSGALIDFSTANIINDESLIFENCLIRRQGVINASDNTIYPNIDETSIKSKWSNNVGLPNTVKYIKSVITTEIPTIISAINTYYPLDGTLIVDPNPSHISMPSNGEFELLSGNGVYHFVGDCVVSGTANDEIDIRVSKSTDGGATYPTQVNHIKRTINNLSGGRDVAFFTLDFISVWNKGERFRVEVENKSGARNVTAEIDSFLIITQV